MNRHATLSILLVLFLLVVGCPPPEDNDTGLDDTGADSGSDVIDDEVDDVDDDGGDTEQAPEVGPDTSPDTDDEDPDGGTDADIGAPDADTGTDADTGSDETDTGPDCSRDTDSDGLNNCEEDRLCTDPTDGDSDGDGLSDLEELQKQTDPCSKDTDNDGADDKEELRFGLNPKKQDSFGDGKLDGDRWILEACKNPQAEPVNFYKDRIGNWTIALPPAFNNYTDLTLTNTSKPQAAAVYDDPANEVAGYLLSKFADSSNSGPVDSLQNDVISDVRSAGTIVQDQTGGAFDTHDGKRAAIGQYRLEVSTKKSTRKIRDDLLLQMAPFGRSDVTSGLPNSAGTRYKTFQVFVSVIYRKNSQGKDQALTSLAVAPRTKFTSVDRVQFRMDDLTNTTNISEQVDAHLVKCATFQPGQGTPRAEFYWVLDQSGSMDSDNQKVAQFANRFSSEVQNTSLDYRLGVTNMDIKNDGRLRVPPAWHTSASTFKSEVQNAVISCNGQPNWACSGGSEHGLEAARRGLKYMTGNSPQPPSPAERIRSDANIVSILMSDEEAHSIDDYKQKSDYINYFKGRTTMFSIVGTGGGFNGCGQDGQRFRDVALATGGKVASLCAKNLRKTIRQIIFAATGLASNYKLPQTPVSSSLRVYLNGTWVPRNRDDGFEYFAENNSIAFFGKFRPSPSKGKKSNDYVAVSYETFKDRCKQNNQGSQNCGGAP